MLCLSYSHAQRKPMVGEGYNRLPRWITASDINGDLSYSSFLSGDKGIPIACC